MALRFRTGNRGEWAQILRVTETAFAAKRSHFTRIYPHAYPGPEAAGRFVVCEEDGRILGAVNRTVYPLRLGSRRVAAVGIGGVCTLPEARGRGVMSGMLRLAEELGRKEGTILGVLWGDRLRYRRYGYEIAGSQSTLALTPRYLAGASAVKLRRLGMEDAAGILRLWRSSPASVDRSLAWQERLLRRSIYRAWGNAEGGLRVYLMALHEHPELLADLGGDPHLAAGAILSYMKGRRLERVEARAVRTDGAWSVLARSAVSVSQGHAGYVAIYDFGRFLEAVAPLLAQRFSAYGARLPVRLIHRGEKRAWDLADRGTTLAVQALPDTARNNALAASSARLDLDGPAWVRVFFPPPGGPQLDGDPDPRLLSALRLPLRIPPCETV